jgi:hypothetical protein
MILEPGTFMVDVDIGEMFLNFFLDLWIRQFAGVDFTKFYPEELDEIKKVFWKDGIVMIWAFSHALLSLFKHWHDWKIRSSESEIT